MLDTILNTVNSVKSIHFYVMLEFLSVSGESSLTYRELCLMAHS